MAGAIDLHACSNMECRVVWAARICGWVGALEGCAHLHACQALASTESMGVCYDFAHWLATPDAQRSTRQPVQVSHVLAVALHPCVCNNHVRICVQIHWPCLRLCTLCTMVCCVVMGGVLGRGVVEGGRRGGGAGASTPLPRQGGGLMAGTYMY